jgi:cell division protein FtsQ
MEQQLPYLETVTIRRKFPGTVVIRVTTAEEAYSLPHGNDFAILSKSLKVLRISEEEPKNLIVLNGLTGLEVQPGSVLQENASAAANSEAASSANTTANTSQNLVLMQKLLAALETSGLEGTSWLDVSDSLDIKMLWDNRLTVLLGAEISLDKKLQYVKAVFTSPENKTISDGEKGTLDVSGYPDSTDRSFLSPE